MTIPTPPQDLVHDPASRFVPAPDLAEWAKATFIDDVAELHNPDHEHLQHAVIGFLWTNVQNVKKGRQVIGTAELGQPQGAMGKWPRERAVQQVEEWFGGVPDFIITLDVFWWVQAKDPERCALVEHELYHCAQDRDPFGAPKFRKSTGLPAFCMRGHDLEEFVGVVRRYGAATSGVQDLVEAANNGPEVALADIAHACGNCA